MLTLNPVELVLAPGRPGTLVRRVIPPARGDRVGRPASTATPMRAPAAAGRRRGADLH
jgi:hypothetical protein